MKRIWDVYRWWGERIGGVEAATLEDAYKAAQAKYGDVRVYA